MHTEPIGLRHLAVERVQGFLAETGMPAWRLGVAAVGDNKFYAKLSRGLGIKLDTIERVELFMAYERARIAAETLHDGNPIPRENGRRPFLGADLSECWSPPDGAELCRLAA